MAKDINKKNRKKKSKKVKPFSEVLKATRYRGAIFTVFSNKYLKTKNNKKFDKYGFNNV